MSNFADLLIRWQQQHGRHNLPWQGTQNPYLIWVAEIMLQQTQVKTVIPFYQRFIETFPTIAALAKADLDDVLALWSGLGYYARGRNLHKAACVIVDQYQGKFPTHSSEIQKLPGIGRTTAAAIAAFCYGEPCTILDGNVKRVLARYFGINGYSGLGATQQQLWEIAEAVLPQSNAQKSMPIYTQALMDLGAMICTRTSPHCTACPLQSHCVALLENRVSSLPTPKPSKVLPSKEAVFLLLQHHDKLLLEKRVNQGIWKELWCLPETTKNFHYQSYCTQTLGIDVVCVDSLLPPIDHTFTHFKLRMYTQRLQVKSIVQQPQCNLTRWVTIDEAFQLAIPTAIKKILSKYRATSIPIFL